MDINQVIYLDNNASTRIDPRVLQAMMPFLTESYANASSIHAFGSRVSEAVKVARTQVALLLECKMDEVVFTSGATEAINLALKGVAEEYGNRRKHIVTLQTEHPATLDTCRHLEQKGFEVTYLPVQSDGLVDLELLMAALRSDTLIVNVMLVNNETGVIQPIKQIAGAAHAHGALFMTDGTQAIGKIPVSVDDMDIDLMAFSGHKFYGPKGVGGLYVRRHSPNKVNLQALIHGGGQEKGIRNGTLNVPGIVGMGEAASIAISSMNEDALFVKQLRDILEGELLKLKIATLNGNSKKRLFNVSNICFKDMDADTIILGLRNIAVSSGSACSSSSMEPSHVLTAMGLTREEAFSSIRFSLGRFNTLEEISFVLEAITNLLAKSQKNGVS